MLEMSLRKALSFESRMMHFLYRMDSSYQVEIEVGCTSSATPATKIQNGAFASPAARRVESNQRKMVGFTTVRYGLTLPATGDSPS